MFKKLGKYEIYKQKNVTVVVYEKNAKYTFYVQKRNVTWHSMKYWNEIKECKKHSIKYLKTL